MSIHKIQRKNGVSYKAVIQVSPTKQKSKKFRRRIDAENWGREQLQKLRSGDTSLLDGPKPFLGDFSAEWLSKYAQPRKEQSSIKRDEGLLKNQILPHFEKRRIDTMHAMEVETWLHHLNRVDELSPTTCNLALGLLKKMLNDAVRWNLIRFNPIDSVRFLPKAEQEMGFWTEDEARTFVDYVSARNVEAFPVFAMAINTGMRRGELKGLQWDCVDLVARQITVRRSFCEKEGRLKEHTKSKRIRRVSINASLLAVLIEARNKGEDPWVLPRSFDFSHASRLVQELAKEAGVREIRFHDLRHTFASNFMMRGGSIYVLQKLLGHSSIKMTERYSHLAPGHLAGATDILDFGLSRQADVVNLQERRA